MTEASCPRTHVGYLKLLLPLNLNCGTRECKLDLRAGVERVGVYIRDKERRRESVVEGVKERGEDRFHDRKIDRQADENVVRIG